MSAGLCVLVVGSGGREHALAWKIAQSPRVARLLAAPGSDAIAALAECHPVDVGDFDGLCALAEAERVDLVVVGPEDPLAGGLADRLRAQGVAVFGPSQAAARLEGSKAFAKDFMQRHAIPTAAYACFDALEPALAYVHHDVHHDVHDDVHHDVHRDGSAACVVKADGLAAGKGVFMCEDAAQAEAALREIMGDRRFGEAGDSVVIEEWLRGEEASYYAISDGTNIVTLAAAQDHKRALDGDRGENTGGMGAYSPAPVCSEPVEKKVLERIVHPAIRGMREDGHPFVGVLFVGLMIDEAGDPYVIEFNVRFGDPETQALMVRMEGDFVPVLEGAARGSLDPATTLGWGDAAVCIALASGGYPRDYDKGKRITGLEALADDEHVVVFHAGTRKNERGEFETNGGRVLGVTARGASVREARDRAYAAADRIHFDGVHLRRDIAARALGR